MEAEQKMTTAPSTIVLDKGTIGQRLGYWHKLKEETEPLLLPEHIYQAMHKDICQVRT